MHGNVREWCEDVYDESFYSKLEASGADPVATSGSVRRVLRGGFWNEIRWNCRAGYRFGCEPELPGLDVGFRVAVPSP
jgi:formylglycine-generating enzyme required for sulfatase activity